MPPSPITTPTYPTGTTQSDLLFSALMEGMVADKIYFGFGTYTDADVDTIYANKAAAESELLANFDSLGELAEKPGKADSKLTKLKTRNYTIPGKRTSTVELTIVGMSAKQKNYLESRSFSGKDMTIVLVSTEVDRIIIFNGMRWTVEWSGEADGLFSVVISTEFAGSTAGKVYLKKDIPVT
jgi:hypothetical protein